MKIKLDENLPTDLAEPLRALGHDVDTVPDEHLTGRPDPDIRAAAGAEGRFLITQDVRFADKRLWKSDPGGGVMLVRVENDTRTRLFHTVMEAFQREDVETWLGQHVVVTVNKVRVSPIDTP